MQDDERRHFATQLPPLEKLDDNVMSLLHEKKKILTERFLAVKRYRRSEVMTYFCEDIFKNND